MTTDDTDCIHPIKQLHPRYDSLRELIGRNPDTCVQVRLDMDYYFLAPLVLTNFRNQTYLNFACDVIYPVNEQMCGFELAYTSISTFHELDTSLGAYVDSGRDSEESRYIF